MKIDCLIVRSEEKAAMLLYLLAKVVGKQKVIVFVATRFHVDYLIALLSPLYAAFGVYGKMDMDQRTSALDGFRRRKNAAVLVVTDLAARGLDIP